MSSQDAPPKAFPTLVGKGGKSLGALPPRNKLSRSGGGSNGAEADAGDSMNAGAARPRSVSPRSPSTSTFSSSSTSSSTLLSSSATPASAAAAGGAGAGGASAVAAAKPKPDLRARALMSHKKMQEQFNPKKATCSGPGAPMSDRLTRDELAGRAVACALEHLGPRPTRAEMRVVADMLRLLRCQQAGRGTATAVAVAAATTSSVALKVSDSKKKHKKDKDNNDKKENKKGDDKKEKKKAKKDGKEKEKKEKKKEKKDKKDKKDPKKAALCASSTSSSMAADGETTGPLTVLGGQLVYSEDSWDPDGDGTNSNGVSGGRHGPLATADTLQLKELVQAHLEPALANLRETPAAADAPDRSAHGLPWAYEIHAKTDKGVRDANEDTYLVLEHFNDLYTMKHAPPQIYIGLFDGHSGKDAAEYCRTQLHMWIAQELENAAGSPGADRTGQLEELALGNAFLRADKIFVDKARCLGVKDGSTAMAALLRGDHLIVANCGDSQGMLCRRTAGGGTELLSLCTTQKPSREDEKERVKSAGGTVVWFGTWRVNGRLAVTRSIGDEDLKHIIIPQPEVQVTQLSPDDEFIVLATDGLWDYMTEDEVATFIRTAIQTKPKSEVSNALVEHVVSTKNSKDNVTIIIVFFDHASSSSSTSSSSSSMAPS